MKKRVLAFCLFVNLLFFALFGRLFSLSVLSTDTISNNSLKVKNIANARGFIYDRNMIPLVNNGTDYSLCVKPSPTTIKHFKEKEHDIFNKLSKGYFVVTSTDTLPEIRTDDIKSLPTFRRYNDNIALHIIGYTDDTGNGVCGIEKYYNNELIESGGALSVAYSTDALGRLLHSEKIEIRDSGYYDKNGIILTIDKSIQQICEDALLNSEITKGAVVVLDIKSNGISACCSLPLYDRSRLSDYIQSKDAPFINKI